MEHERSARRVVTGLITWLAAGLLALSLTPVAADEHRSAARPDCEHHPDVLLAAQAAPPVRTGLCEGVRPGGQVQFQADGGTGCTLNFVVRGWSDEGEPRTFIGTAGHCVLPAGDGSEAQQEVWEPGAGPAAQVRTGGQRLPTGVTIDAEFETFGHVVYAVNDYPRDFALIELLPDVEPDAQVCHWGGPTGVDPGPRDGALWVQHSGHGLYLTDVIPGRTGLATYNGDPDEVAFIGAANFGDSGSPVVDADTGQAVSIVTGSRYISEPEPGELPTQDKGVAGPRWAPQVDLAIEALELTDWELVTAERLD